MDVVNERCAGLDVHKRTVVACVRIPSPGGGREPVPVRSRNSGAAGFYPPGVYLTNTAPYLAFVEGTERDQAACLGLMNSLPLGAIYGAKLDPIGAESDPLQDRVRAVYLGLRYPRSPTSVRQSLLG